MTKYIWKSTYKQSMGEYFSHALNELESYRFIALWGSFVDTRLLQSMFFQTISIGDSYHNLWVHKNNNGTIIVEFTIK